MVLLSFALALPGRADYAYPAKPRVYSYPPSDRTWGPLDLLTVDAILRASPAETYPRLSSAATRPLFLRMVDAAPFMHAADASVPLIHRLIDLRTYDGVIGSYRSRYNVGALRGALLQAELVRLQVHQLELTALAVQLTEAFVASLDEAERQQLKQMHFFDTFGTLRTHVTGTVISLSEARLYTVAERVELAEALGRTFPRLRRIFAAGERERMADEIVRLAGLSRDPELGRTLAETAQAIAAP